MLTECGVMIPRVCPILIAASLSISPVDVPLRVIPVTCLIAWAVAGWRWREFISAVVVSVGVCCSSVVRLSSASGVWRNTCSTLSAIRRMRSKR